MGTYLVVIIHVRQQDVTEVSLAEHNNVVKAFPSDRTDQPFSICVLPRGTRRCWSVANAYRSESADKDLTIGLCVPKTLSELMTRWDRLSWRNDLAALVRS